MRIWPFRQRAADVPEPVSVGTVRARAAYNRPYGDALGYLPPPADVNVFRIMRRALPVLDTAVDLLVKLTGDATVVWDSDRVQSEWDAWAEQVHVAPLGVGFNWWLNGHIERAIMYGTAASEIVLDSRGRDIYGFQFIPTNTLKLRPDPENPMRIVIAQQQPGNPTPVVLDRDFIAINAHEPEDDSPYGQSIWADCPFMSELLIEMTHATKQDWNRVGAPSFALTVEVPPGLDPSVDVQSLMGRLLGSIKQHWTDAMTSRREGTIKDFFGAGNIKIQTVGADGSRLEFATPWRSAMEQIVAVSHLPAWMLGLHWSSTERLSQEQAQALEDVILDYQSDYTPTVAFVADWWARVRGYANIDRVIDWPALSIRDRVEQARAAVFEAQAAASRESTGAALWRAGVFDQQRYADFVCDEENTEIAEQTAVPPMPSGGGLFLSAKSAPTAKFEADEPEVEVPYSGEQPKTNEQRAAIQSMYNDCRAAVIELRDRVFELLGLDVQRRAPGINWDEPTQAAFDEAVELFLTRMAGEDRTRMGFVSPETADGIIQEHDRFAYALGIRDISDLGATDTDPLLPSRNSEGVRHLLERAFDRLSDQGRLRLEGVTEDLRGIIEGGMARGVSPLDMAKEMGRRFDQYAGWEFQRLARTEVAFSQVDGQLAECRAEGIDTSGVEGDPPPWHPNCLCSISIDRDEDGTWRAHYDVAATACELCQTYAGR